MVPRAYAGKPGAIIATWQHGRELGVGLFQALNGISNINGNVAVYGDLGWALVQNHPDFVDSLEEITETYAVCTLKRRGRSDKTWKYTLDMAKQNDLLGKENWKKNPRRMLQWRARSWCMRDQFPDALKGMVIYEEAQDYSDGPTIDAQPVQAQTQAQPAVVEDKKPEEPITLEQATAWYRAYKAHGWTPDEAKAFLKDKFQIEEPRNSKDIPKSKVAEAMQWAETKAPVRVEVEGAMDVLGWTIEEKQKYVSDNKLNWAAMRDDLSKKIGERDAREKF